MQSTEHTPKKSWYALRSAVRYALAVDRKLAAGLAVTHWEEHAHTLYLALPWDVLELVTDTLAYLHTETRT